MSRNFQDWFFDRRGFDQPGDPYRNYMGLPEPGQQEEAADGDDS